MDKCNVSCLRTDSKASEFPTSVGEKGQRKYIVFLSLRTRQTSPPQLWPEPKPSKMISFCLLCWSRAEINTGSVSLCGPCTYVRSREVRTPSVTSSMPSASTLANAFLKADLPRTHPLTLFKLILTPPVAPTHSCVEMILLLQGLPYMLPPLCCFLLFFRSNAKPAPSKPLWHLVCSSDLKSQKDVWDHFYVLLPHLIPA